MQNVLVLSAALYGDPDGQAWREVYPLGNESSGFLQDGGLSIGAMSPLGLSLPEVLANEATGGGRKQINVIFMFLQGGFW